MTGVVMQTNVLRSGTSLEDTDDVFHLFVEIVVKTPEPVLQFIDALLDWRRIIAVVDAVIIILWQPVRCFSHCDCVSSTCNRIPPLML